ncbi:MAG TPA: ABC transporter permease [Acidimicrobiales bacterium]|nr:ABC transporter permease [Acidimicrobiales bacterium]
MDASPAVARGRSSSLEDRARPGLLLFAGQVRYQLLLLIRSPVASFITLVVPLMLLVALDLVTPEMTLRSLRGTRVTQFLTPAMASFAVLNCGFVNTVIGTTLAREQGILKRLRGTPLPAWTYLAGRLGAAVVLTACSVTAVLGAGVVLFHAHLALSSLSPLVGSIAAGLVVSFALGVATAGLVKSSEAALPIAYGLLLPVAFISGVFFPAPNEAHWLRTFAAALPVQPFASAMEGAFATPPRAATLHQLAVLALWSLGAVTLGAIGFSWQPREPRRSRGAHGRSRRRGPRTAQPAVTPAAKADG